MSLIIIKTKLPYKQQETNAILFFPKDPSRCQKSIALITHGYTSHKGSLLNWAMRLAEEGIPTALFDLPGHYLGNYSEVNKFEDFSELAPKLFYEAYRLMIPQTEQYAPEFSYENIIIGGHSLGAMLALKSFETRDLFPEGLHFHYLCVGLGIYSNQTTHLYETDFYKATMAARSQLVSPALAPEKIFPWIKLEKNNFKVRNQKIYILAGEDDLVISKDGAHNVAQLLKKNSNDVTLETPKHLPHHMPELAAPHIRKYLRRIGLLPKKKVF